MMGYDYPGPFDPMDHQVTTSQFMVDNPRSFVLNDMGTGKTASALWAIDRLMTQGKIKRALIIAPLQTLNKVWLEETFKLLTGRRSVVLHGAARKRRQLYEAGFDIGIINYDGVNVLREHIKADRDLNCILVDEASEYKNARTNKWKLLYKLSEHIPYFWLLTGTPTPNAPTDAWALAKMIRNGKASKFFGSFERETMRQVSQFVWVPLPDGYDKAFRILQPAIRFHKEDCIDLPPLTYQQWEVDLSAHQKLAYKHMQKKMRIEWSGGGESLTAANAADRINKLRQIACGVIRDTSAGEYLVLDHKPRLDATVQAIENATAKTIVVVPFKGIINHLAYEIEAQGYTTAVINGDVPYKLRNDIITRFRTTTKPEVLLVHPKVMSHGLTLVEADTMVFYAPIYSNEQTQQIIQRINRPGQDKKMTVVMLGATPMEWSIYAKVEQRAEGETYLLDLYKSAFDDKV